MISAQKPTGVTFLQPCKKVTKEDGIGEALTAKPIGSAVCTSPFSPASSRPPLCTPSGAGRKTGISRISLSSVTANESIRNYVRNYLRIEKSLDGGRVGVWGRAAQSWGRSAGLHRQLRKTLRSAHPPAAFFGSFLVRTQEMNTRQIYGLNHQNSNSDLGNR